MEIYRGGAAGGGRHGEHKELIGHARQGPVTVRAQDCVLCRGRLLGPRNFPPGDFDVGAPVGSVVAHRNQASTGVEVNAVFLVGEMRRT